MDIKQTEDYIKVSCKTYLDRILDKYFMAPINLRVDDMGEIKPTPLPNRQTFQKSFLNAKGDPDPKAQAALAKQMGFGYRNVIRELIYAMVTCRPHLSYAVVRSSQFNTCPAEVYYHSVCHMLKYLFLTKADGINYWRQQPNKHLVHKAPPKINSNLHDLHLNGRPKDNASLIAE